MKTCPTCKQEKPFDDFSIHRGRKDGRQSTCKICKRARDSRSYQANPKWYQERNRRVRDRNREYVWQYLQDHPCVDCGEADAVVLEFDHLTEKDWNVSEMIVRGRTLPALQAEIDKCEVRCCNCHRRITAQRGNHWRFSMGSGVLAARGSLKPED